MSKTKAYEYKRKVSSSCEKENSGLECYQLYDYGCQGLYVDYLGNYMCEPGSLERGQHRSLLGSGPGCPPCGPRAFARCQLRERSK